MTLKTPRYDLRMFPSVYDPSEDTFLFLDALEMEIDFITRLKPAFCVEIGSGSGVLSSAISTITKNSVTFGTDVNENACLATNNTAKLNNIVIECCRMDLLSQFKDNLFDLILFNPPYVPTDDEEVQGFELNRSWAGGLRGRKILDNLLKTVNNMLSHNGVMYLLLLKENGVDEIRNIMENEGFYSNIVIERKILGEYLYVVKFFRSC